MIKTYSELIQLPTFEDRLEYLRIFGSVGIETYGFDRYVNQIFYKSRAWKKVRNQIILRDSLGSDYCCDLAMPGHEILDGDKIIIHHINPISMDDILDRNLEVLLNPEFLISVTHKTHNFIHYGTESSKDILPIERSSNDMCPWR